MNIKDLQIITNDTLKEIKQFEVITPALFNDTFFKKAKKLDPNFKKKDICEHGVENILDKVLKIQKETKEHTNILKENIDLATVAIEKKDDRKLGEVKNNIDDLYRRIMHLEQQVYIDELTKVYNRKWLYEELLENNKFKSDGSLTFVDVDKFKNINDNYGHVAGDKVLVMISSLTKKLPNSQSIRYGGDEFLVVSTSVDSKCQLDFFDKINQNLLSKSLTYQGNVFHVGISFGSVDYKKGEHFSDILEKVDKLMYQHKKRRSKIGI